MVNHLVQNGNKITCENILSKSLKLIQKSQKKSHSEIIKLAPIIKQLNKKSTSVIFTGQHYDHNMGMRFIDQLGLNKPNYSIC